MRTPTKVTALFWVALAVALALVTLAATSPSITWTFRGSPLFVRSFGGETLELGCRSDGVVVWRRTSSSTNSPAEAAATTAPRTRSPGWTSSLTPPPLPVSTNAVMIYTNFVTHTNIVVTNVTVIVTNVAILPP